MEKVKVHVGAKGPLPQLIPLNLEAVMDERLTTLSEGPEMAGTTSPPGRPEPRAEKVTLCSKILLITDGAWLRDGALLKVRLVSK